MGVRATITSCVAALLLAVAAASASAQNISFCKAAAGAAKGLSTKKLGFTKAFNVQGGGTSCEYGGTLYGADIEWIPHEVRAAFFAKQRAMKGKTVSGVGTSAFSMAGSNGYTALYVLQGTNEIVIYSKASLTAEKAAAKAALPLLH